MMLMMMQLHSAQQCHLLWLFEDYSSYFVGSAMAASWYAFFAVNAGFTFGRSASRVAVAGPCELEWDAEFGSFFDDFGFSFAAEWGLNTDGFTVPSFAAFSNAS